MNEQKTKLINRSNINNQIKQWINSLRQFIDRKYLGNIKTLQNVAGTYWNWKMMSVKVDNNSGRGSEGDSDRRGVSSEE